MLYADMALSNYPLGWEELEWKLDALRRLNWSYQLEVGRQMFSLEGPMYQFRLVRWGHRPDVDTPAKREVLYEGHDYYAVLGFVSMLLTAEEEKRA